MAHTLGAALVVEARQRINLWARLRDADHAYAVLARMLHPERSYGGLPRA